MCYEITYEREVTYNGRSRITKLRTPPKRQGKINCEIMIVQEKLITKLNIHGLFSSLRVDYNSMRRQRVPILRILFQLVPQ